MESVLETAMHPSEPKQSHEYTAIQVGPKWIHLLQICSSHAPSENCIVSMDNTNLLRMTEKEM